MNPLDVVDIDDFERDGFLKLSDFTSEREIGPIRDVYDAIMDGSIEIAGDRMLGGVTRQVMNPSNELDGFAENDVLRAGFNVATALLGTADLEKSFEMLIFKPPGHPNPTPWHQDMAYMDHPFAPAGSPIALGSIQFWVALDDADEENGCMHFAPGFHTRPLLEHRVASGDPLDDSRLLELAHPDRDLSDAPRVACPIRAGGATAHTLGTPHYTPSNESTTRPRRAYIFNIATREINQTLFSRTKNQL
jgi:hypothetical protein